MAKLGDECCPSCDSVEIEEWRAFPFDGHFFTTAGELRKYQRENTPSKKAQRKAKHEAYMERFMKKHREEQQERLRLIREDILPVMKRPEVKTEEYMIEWMERDGWTSLTFTLDVEQLAAICRLVPPLEKGKKRGQTSH